MSIMELQAQAYQLLSKGLLALKLGDTNALWTFYGAAFLYGVFHAAGPGHGKAVISSYLLATGDSLKRGLILSWISSLMQGLVALLFVGLAVWVFEATSKMMQTGLAALDLIFAIGLLLIGVRLIYRWFIPDASCAHLPPVEQFKTLRHWYEDISLIFTIAIRPCSGAIFIAFFALSQGLWLYGLMAVLLMAIGTAITVSGLAIIAVYMKKLAVKLAVNGSKNAILFFKGLELVAAFILIGFAILLLSGILSIEKMGALR